jgi:Tol biopolymer transport system component
MMSTGPRTAGMGLIFAGLGLLLVQGQTSPGAREERAAPNGRIYTTAMEGARDEKGAETSSIIAIDPETGNWTSALDDCQMRPRVSPDGRTVAFARGDRLWVSGVAGAEAPMQVLDLDGTTAGSPPAWSADGKQIIISLGSHEKDGGRWAFKTVRVNADGTGKTELNVPREDGVQDWSADGQWLLTASSRNAEIGWQLYVMHPDGTGQRQVTEGGNPFYARFSPDGRRLLYTDGTTEQRRGIWMVSIDGKDRRRVFATGKVIASACWSPDGTRMAVIIRKFEDLQDEPRTRLLLIDLDGAIQKTVPLPEKSIPDMPDWR